MVKKVIFLLVIISVLLISGLTLLRYFVKSWVPYYREKLYKGSPSPLETERLILRAIRLNDVEAIYHYTKNPAVSKLLEWEPSTSTEETQKIVEQWLKNYERNEGEAPWGIVFKETGKVIGTIAVRLYENEKSSGELGFCLSQDYWGKGLMVEAIECIKRYVFTKTGLVELAAFVRTDNLQSQRVLQKSGFVLEKVKAKQKIIKGKRVDLDRWVCYKSFTI